MSTPLKAETATEYTDLTEKGIYGGAKRLVGITRNIQGQPCDSFFVKSVQSVAFSFADLLIYRFLKPSI